MEVTLEPLIGPPIDAQPVEVVERKGLGHPDTICDALAERLSLALSRFYRERFGTILHHNVDKVLLWGGRAEPAFGGGRVVAPIEIYLAGRATLDHGGVAVPVEEFAVEGTRAWLAEYLRYLDPNAHVRVHPLVRPGSTQLVEVFGRGAASRAAPPANDTSLGVGYAPLSLLERVVLAVERALNSPAAKAACPALGEDVKVMGARRGTDIGLTIACAMVDRHLGGLDDYAAAKQVAARIATEAARDVGAPMVDVTVNGADDLSVGSAYLTVTGTSAEAGDDGEAGRGNRVNGLIAPARPMTLESVAGKNPVTHVGKLYNLAAGLLAHSLVEAIDGLVEAHCWLVSRIGDPIDQPWIAHVRARGIDGGPVDAHRTEIEAIVRSHLARVGELADDLLDGRIAPDRWPLTVTA